MCARGDPPDLRGRWLWSGPRGVSGDDPGGRALSYGSGFGVTWVTVSAKLLRSTLPV